MDNAAILEKCGLAILKFDTRWVIVASLLCVGIFYLVLRFGKQHRAMSTEEGVNLGLVLLQLYSAPVLLAVLVLTQPPAIDQISGLERQSAGLLAFIFMVGGVLQQIGNLWKADRNKSPQQPATAASTAADKSGDAKGTT